MRVLVTRPEEHAEELAERLRALGHEPVACPLVRLEAMGPDTVDVSAYDWVVITSKTGAEHLARRGRGAMPRVAAIGPGTAATLRAHGIEPALVSAVSTQEGLVAEFPRPAGRVLFAGAEAARRVVVDALGADFVALYRTVPAPPEGGLPPGDLVIVASPSAARVLAPAWLALPVEARPRVVSIGPVTSEAARAAGLPVDVEAAHFDLDGLLDAIQRAAAAADAGVAP